MTATVRSPKRAILIYEKAGHTRTHSGVINYTHEHGRFVIGSYVPLLTCNLLPMKRHDSSASAQLPKQDTPWLEPCHAYNASTLRGPARCRPDVANAFMPNGHVGTPRQLRKSRDDWRGMEYEFRDAERSKF